MRTLQYDKVLKPFGSNIWTIDGDDVRMFGALPFTTRMTVVKLETGGLWLHSPVLPTKERREALERLGPIEHLVAPIKIHSIGIPPWSSLVPSAQVWASPQFTERHPEIRVDTLLTNEVRPPWGKEIEHLSVEGHPVVDEVDFLHKRSSTLILTDLIQKHFADRDSSFWRGVKKTVGVLGERGGVPLDIRLSIQDRSAMRRSIEKILEWDFDNFILSHGHCLRGGAREEVRRVFAWLLRATQRDVDFDISGGFTN
ncbi:MAG: DUF4336 domain-containing protein [Pseudomonadota bacterium]